MLKHKQKLALNSFDDFKTISIIVGNYWFNN